MKIIAIVTCLLISGMLYAHDFAVVGDEQIDDKEVQDKTSSSAEAYQFYLAGVNRLNESEFDKASVEFLKVVELDGQFKKAWFKLALSQWWEQKDEDAKNALDKMAACASANENDRIISEGVKFLIDGKFEDAVVIFEEIVRNNIENQDFQYCLGEAYYHRGGMTLKSLDAFEKVVSLDPEFSLAYIHIFDIYVDEGLFDRGISRANHFVELHPESARGYKDLAGMYKAAGRFNEALDALAQAKRINPEKLDYHLEIANLYKLMGLYSDAIAVFDEILAGDELKVTAAMGKSRVYFILGEHSKGINMLEISLSFAGVDTNETAYILSNMAAHSIYSAEYVQANRYLDRALELNPDNIFYVLYWAGFLHAEQSDEESLISTMKSIRDLLDEKKNEFWENAYTALLIERFILQGDFDKALAEIKNFEKIWHDHYLYHAAMLHIEKGDYKQAIQLADEMQAPSVGGNAYWFVFPRGYYVRGLSYEAMGKLDKAKENYKSLLDLWKNADATIPELIDTRKRLSSILKL